MKNPLNKINSKELTMVLCTTLNVLCMIASLVIVFYANPNKQVKEPLSARSELPKNQVIVYRIYYNEKDSPTIKVEQPKDPNAPIDLKGSNTNGNISNHGG